MLQLQQMKAFLLSVGIQLVPRTEQLQLPNTKTEIGKSLVTWLKLEVIMVQLPLDILQWLSVVILVEQRKCIVELEPEQDLSDLIFKHDYRAVGIGLFRKPDNRTNLEQRLQYAWLILGRYWILQQELRNARVISW